MKSKRWPYALAAFALSVVACSKSQLVPEPAQSTRGNEEVIYGDDNRSDYFDVKDLAIRALSESTVALMSSSQIAPEVNGLRTFKGANYGTSLGLCSGERFAEQNTGAFCSGFLIADDLIVTAGHCVPDLKSCGETSYVFGYRVMAPGILPLSAPASEVYSCKELLHSQAPSDGADFAIVKLDRKVKNHLPLPMRLNGDVKIGDPLTVMGYPEGLPLKVADGAAVRTISKPGFFVANTDTYGGNSGSAVINSTTRLIEGVLVRGEKDFEWTPAGCARSYRCKDTACRGEDITRIGEIAKTLTALGY